MGSVLALVPPVVAFLHHGIHETFQATGRLGRMISTAARLARVRASEPISQPARLSASFGAD
jgi:hypothetical protein